MKQTQRGNRRVLPGRSGPSTVAVAVASRSQPDRRPDKVLVVDDDPAVRKSLLKLLREAGYEVAAAADAREALERFDERPLDLLVLDLGLPARSGWEIFEHVTNEDPALPIIILTGRPNQIRMAAAAGVGALMEKPVDPRELLRTMKEVIAEPRKVRLRRAHGRTQKIRYLPSGDTAFPNS